MKTRKSVDVKDSSIEDAERTLKSEATTNVINYLHPVRPLVNNGVVLHKIDDDWLGLLTPCEPLTFPRIDRLTDETTCVIDPETGIIKLNYVPDSGNNPFGARKQKGTKKKDDDSDNKDSDSYGIPSE